MKKPNYKGADGLLEEVIQEANKAIPKTKQAAFWSKVHDKTDAMTEAIQFAREDGFKLGHGEGFEEGYKKGYHDGHTDRLEEETTDG
jgi:flagellar biosynthesis/type III secretory pathway protein FliH